MRDLRRAAPHPLPQTPSLAERGTAPGAGSHGTSSFAPSARFFSPAFHLERSACCAGHRVRLCEPSHVKPATLTPLLDLSESPAGSRVSYFIGGANLAEPAREVAAQLIADDGMRVACGNAPVLGSWRARRDGGAPHPPVRRQAVETYASIAFGLPGAPPNTDHLQGHVAELIWNRVLGERETCVDGRRLVKAHSVKADPTEPGGDGLVIYRDSDGDLVFRLWEIKKHAATARISATINRASSQLEGRGHEYLAKLAAPETLTAEGELLDLYGEMVELWFDRSVRAGVGVAVGTTKDNAPRDGRTFRSIRTRFPAFTSATQTEGLVVALPDFAGFADRVKEIVWSGL